jgi:hypothetical protein
MAEGSVLAEARAEILHRSGVYEPEMQSITQN